MLESVLRSQLSMAFASFDAPFIPMLVQSQTHRCDLGKTHSSAKNCKLKIAATRNLALTNP